MSPAAATTIGAGGLVVSTGVSGTVLLSTTVVSLDEGGTLVLSSSVVELSTRVSVVAVSTIDVSPPLGGSGPPVLGWSSGSPRTALTPSAAPTMDRAVIGRIPTSDRPAGA